MKSGKLLKPRLNPILHLIIEKSNEEDLEVEDCANPKQKKCRKCQTGYLC
jgi:hypothetical protein